MYVLSGTSRYKVLRRKQFKKSIIISSVLLIVMVFGALIAVNLIRGQVILASPTQTIHPVLNALHISSSVTSPPVSSQYKLIVPKINLNIPVIPVGLTKSGAMDVPYQTNAAGLYKYGPLPGQKGSAVIDGHNEIKQVGEGVFGSLNKISVGDKIIFQNKGVSLQFSVKSMVQYPVSQLPSNKVFNIKDGYHLNLITCAGKWNRSTQSYPDRLVIYNDLDK